MFKLVKTGTVWLKICAGQIFRQAQVPLYCRNIQWNKFSPIYMVRVTICSLPLVIINAGQKNFAEQKFHQQDQVAQLVKSFSWQKFLAIATVFESSLVSQKY